MSGVLLTLILFANPIVDGDPEVRIQFFGHTSFAERTLRSAAVDDFIVLERNDYPKSTVDDIAFQIESYYRQQGFPKAIVDYLYERTGGSIQIAFFVNEGKRAKIRHVRISGNTAFSDQQIENMLGELRDGLLGTGDTFFVQSDVESAVSAIRTGYIESGFSDVEIEGPIIEFNTPLNRVDIDIRIREGIRYTLSQVTFEGNKELDGATLRESIHELLEQPYSPRKRHQVKAQLLEVYGNSGFADATLNIEEKTPSDNGKVSLHAQIVEGVHVTIDRVILEGAEDTRRSFLYSRLVVEDGDAYSLKKLRESTSRLYSTGLFLTVDTELRGQGEVRDLVITVQERDSMEFSVMPGYGSYEKLRLEVELRERSVFGSGRAFAANAGLSKKSEWVRFTWSDPYLMGSEFEFDIPLEYRKREEPSFTTREVSLGLIVSRQFTREFQTALGYEIKGTTILDEDIDLNGDEDLIEENIRIGSVTLDPKYDSRDNLFNPGNGIVLGWVQEYADQYLGSEASFFRSALSFSTYHTLGRDSILAARVRSEIIVPIHDTEVVPLQERLFSGGENSVRSFRESHLGPLDDQGDPIGGEVSNLLNVEWRRRLKGNLHGALFYDLGNVVLDANDAYFSDLRSATGLGLRYLLPIGAIRLDGAYNINRRSGEDSVRVHLSVGMAF